MERLSKREIQGEKTKSEIVTAAIRLFARNGYHATSISEIALAARVSKGSVYWHFENKDSLVHAAIDQVIEEWKEIAVQGLDQEKTARHKIERLIDNHYKVISENTVLCVMTAVLIVEVSEVHSELEREFRNIFRQYQDFIASILKAGQTDGSIRPDIDAEAEATQIVWSLEGILMNWILHRDRELLATLIDSLKFSLFEGIRAR